ncbi:MULTISPECIES: hypothetical protein [Yersinia]|uniref:hypothetical protein n=1 Tax=Yersinia TaxID=629 RepID=UPI001867D421|nr:MULTISPECIES: hypothetical protein [Yersinia]
MKKVSTSKAPSRDSLTKAIPYGNEQYFDEQSKQQAANDFARRVVGTSSGVYLTRK